LDAPKFFPTMLYRLAFENTRRKYEAAFVAPEFFDFLAFGAMAVDAIHDHLRGYTQSPGDRHSAFTADFWEGFSLHKHDQFRQNSYGFLVKISVHSGKAFGPLGEILCLSQVL
jgi:hypothetical protein